jgi:hypothetical protein
MLTLGQLAGHQDRRKIRLSGRGRGWYRERDQARHRERRRAEAVGTGHRSIIG